MKLYNSVGPNPKVVRMFVAECGIEIDQQDVDLMSGENRQAEYMGKINPTGTLPALNRDNNNIAAWYDRVKERFSAAA